MMATAILQQIFFTPVGYSRRAERGLTDSPFLGSPRGFGTLPNKQARQGAGMNVMTFPLLAAMVGAWKNGIICCKNF